MLKLIFCLVSALTVAVLVLELRQQRLEINYQINRLHGQIESQQAKLWDQQRNIAIDTAPNAIQRSVNSHDLHMVTGPATGGSMASTDADAE